MKTPHPADRSTKSSVRLLAALALLLAGTAEAAWLEGNPAPLLADPDIDADGLPDAYELANTTPPSATDLTPGGDDDGDILTNLQEYQLGTRANVADTDGDGAEDWYEVNATLTSPTNSASKPRLPYPLPRPDGSKGATNKPVKVFILSGQSNMVGMGDRDPTNTPGTLSTIVKQEGKFPNLLDTNGNWSVHGRVWYRSVISELDNAALTAGQGAGTAIGPELGFGHAMGYFLDEPVLLIKSSIGNRSLLWDCLTPGSQRFDYGGNTYAGYGESPNSWPIGGNPSPFVWYAGKQYDDYFLAETNMGAPAWADGTYYYTNNIQVRHNGQTYISKGGAHTASPGTEPGVGGTWTNYWNTYSVFNVVDILDNWATQYTNWAAQGFEISGFVWFQGNKDLGDPAASRYESNLVHLIKHLRSYYADRYPGRCSTNTPFVIATGCGDPGTNGFGLTVANAQLAMNDTARYPEFAGNVKTMDTRSYWREVAVSPANQGYHYNRNAETYVLTGDALGRGMISLLSPPVADPGGPYTVRIGETLSLTGTNSLPSDGASITNYSWDLNNDGTFGDVTGGTPAAISAATLTGTWGMVLGANPVGLRVQDSSGQAGAAMTTVTLLVALTADATLTSLVSSAGTLAPAFAGTNFNYAATVPYLVGSLTVTPTAAAGTNATITVNGTNVVSGNASGTIGLSVGANAITTVVVSADQGATNIYTLTVNRAVADARLTGLVPGAGTLSPAFADNVFSYTASVPFVTSSMTVTPTAADPAATIKVNGTNVASGNASGSLGLGVGANIISTVVVGQDALTTNTYTLTVNREAPSAALTSLVPSSGTLSPVFASTVFSYTTSVRYATATIAVTPTAAVGTNATITVNGTNVVSGNTSGLLALDIGSNVIATVVLSEDQSLTNTYLLTVIRTLTGETVYWDGGAADIGTNGNGASGGGAGTWDTTIRNWDVGAVPHTNWNNANNDIPVFGGTAGTVTNLGVTVGGMIFTTANYVLTSNTVTFGTAGSISNTAATTISSALAGTGPVAKEGAGTLTLSGSNSFSGGLTVRGGTTILSATNTFSGAITVQAGGTLQVGTGGNDAMLGAASNSLILSGGALTFASINLTCAREVSVQAAGGSIQVNKNNNFTTTGRLTGSGALTLRNPGGSGGQPAYNFNATSNDFTGPLQFVSGTAFTCNSFPDSTNNIIVNYGGDASASLFTYGAGATSALTLASRALEINATSTVAVTLGNNSTNHAVTVLRDLIATGGGTKTLTLSAAAGPTNVFAGNIANGTGGGAVALAKSGAGTWALCGTNTYTGATAGGSVNGSTLIFQEATKSLPSATTINAGAGNLNNVTVKLLDDGAGTIALGNTVRTSIAGSSGRSTVTLFVGNNGAANGGNGAGTNQNSVVRLGNLDLRTSQGGEGGLTDYRMGQEIAVTGANGYSLQIANVLLPARGGGGGPGISPTLSPASAALTITGTIQQVNGKTGTDNTTPDMLILGGTGSVNVISGSIRNAADYDDNSNTNARPASVTKSGASTWTLSGSNSFSGGLTLSGATAGSRLNINHPWALGSGTFTISGGNNGRFDNTSGAALTNANNNAMSWLSDFTFLGTHDLDLGTGAVTLGGNRALTISAGTLTVGGPIGGTNFGITKAGAGALVLNGTNTYTGATTVNSGGLLVNGEVGTNNVTVTGGTLGGSGLCGGNVTNRATVAPGASAGRLTVGGNYVQATNGTFLVEIGGPAPGTQHDVLAVSNNATLSGTLTVVLTNGYTGVANHSFTILTAASVSGRFSATNLPALGGGNEWNVDYLGGAVVLSITNTGVPPATGYNAFSNLYVLALGPEGDDDGDGFLNLYEYMSGSNPTNGGSKSPLSAVRTNGTFALRFQRDTNSTDITITAEGAFSAENSAVWNGIATNSNGSWGAATNVVESGTNPVQVTIFDNDPAATNRHLRLRITRP